MKLFTTLLFSGVFSVIALGQMNCSSSPKKDEAVTEAPSEIKDPNGKVIGKYKQTSKERAVMSYFDDKGSIEREVEVVDNKVQKVTIDSNKDGQPDQVVIYADNAPKSIDFYDGTSGSIKNKAHVIDKKIKYVDVVSKSKRVFFKEDGSIEKVEDIR